MKELYRFRQFLTEGVIKENIMVSPIIMFGGKKYIEDVISSPDDFGFDKDDAEWVKNNILSSPKRVSIQDYMDLDDKWVKQAQIDTSGGGALDHVVDGLKIHVKQELITPEQEKEAMKVVGLSEGVIKEEQMGSYGKFLKVVKSYEDEEILSDFLDSYPKGQDISKSEYERFTEKHLGLADPEDYRGENWKYIMSESVIKEELKAPSGWSEIKDLSDMHRSEEDDEIAVKAWDAPMEGWDEENKDIIVVRKEDDKFYLDGYIPFGSFDEQGPFDTYEEALKLAVEEMEAFKEDWDEQ